jgi:hypothetical protein
MSEWYHRGTDSRELGICFYCGDDTAHFDSHLEIDLCNNPQCLSEAYAASDEYTDDLVERFNKGEE